MSVQFRPLPFKKESSIFKVNIYWLGCSKNEGNHWWEALEKNVELETPPSTGMKLEGKTVDWVVWDEELKRYELVFVQADWFIAESSEWYDKKVAEGWTILDEI